MVLPTTNVHAENYFEDYVHLSRGYYAIITIETFEDNVDVKIQIIVKSGIISIHSPRLSETNVKSNSVFRTTLELSGNHTIEITNTGSSSVTLYVRITGVFTFDAYLVIVAILGLIIVYRLLKTKHKKWL
jgi:hypothetical protein